MAFICDAELESGLTINNAYLRVTSFSGTESRIRFILSIYVNEESYIEDKPSISSVAYEIDYDKNKNIFRQMYEYLRTLPEYESAVEA